MARRGLGGVARVDLLAGGGGEALVLRCRGSFGGRKQLWGVRDRLWGQLEIANCRMEAMV